jgi:poly(3-hydroxybutyrate) depolymerase
MAARTIDRSRVYEIGTSSGALITSDLAAAYPDIFTAIGIMAGGPYGADTCLTGQAGAPSVGDTSLSASEAYSEEGSRARVIPFIVLNGDADKLVSPGCDDQAVEQWLQTDNLALSGQEDKPLSLASARDQAERPAVKDGYTYNVLSYTTPGGCLIGQHDVIHGMGHGWSGGTTDPEYANGNDPLASHSQPLGPSAARASWAFFSRFRRSTKGTPCASHHGRHKRHQTHHHRSCHGKDARSTRRDLARGPHARRRRQRRCRMGH